VLSLCYTSFVVLKLSFFQAGLSLSVVAWYAALVATLTAAIQVATYLRERVWVRLMFAKRQQVWGSPEAFPEGKIYTHIKVVNMGRRPVTFTGVGFTYLKGGGAVFLKSVPEMPCEITEGKHISVLADESKLDFNRISHFQATDASGRLYRVPVAGLLTRVFWTFRRKLSRS
jgi:hypothetical protein